MTPLLRRIEPTLHPPLLLLWCRTSSDSPSVPAAARLRPLTRPGLRSREARSALDEEIRVLEDGDVDSLHLQLLIQQIANVLFVSDHRTAWCHPVFLLPHGQHTV